MPSVDDAAARARRLLSSRPAEAGGAATESAFARVGPPDAADAAAIARRLKQLRGHENSGSSELDRLAASIVGRAQAAMQQLDNGASVGAIADADKVALESVILTRGRPALAVEGQRIEAIDAAKHPGSDFWRIPLNDHEAQLVRVAGATGAVTVRDRLTGAEEIRGTAWLIRGDLVITNRHVIFPDRGVPPAKRRADLRTEATLKADFEVIIDFAYDDGPARTSSCRVVGIPYISEDADAVDVAILRISDTTIDGGPLTLERRDSASKQLYLFGHPGPLAEIPADVQAVFGTPNGRKRVSFGEVMPADGAQRGELIHDASTIGGFSGGCVVAFGSSDVAALHYYGDPLRGNRAITAQTLRAHAAGTFFQ